MNATWKTALVAGVLSIGLGGETLIQAPAAQAAEIVIGGWPVRAFVHEPLPIRERAPGHEVPAHINAYGEYVPAHWVHDYYEPIR